MSPLFERIKLHLFVPGNMRIAQQRADMAGLISRTGSKEILTAQLLHPTKIDKVVRLFACPGSCNRQTVQKVQKIPGKVTVVSRHDQPADGVLFCDLVRFGLQLLGIDRLVDEARILFQHGSKDLVFALMLFPPTDPLKLLQKVVLPKRFVGAEVVIRQLRLLGEPISLVRLRAAIPTVRQIGRTELIRLE